MHRPLALARNGSIAVTATLLLLVTAGGCRKGRPVSSPGGVPVAPQAAAGGATAAPVVSVEGKGPLLLTYAERDGSFHTVTDIASVPSYARGVVRVVDPAAPPDLDPDDVWVVDLRQPGRDGRFPTRRLARSAFEDSALAALAGAPPLGEPSGPPTDDTTGAGVNPPPTVSKAPIIIYGASWCGACQAAKQYLTAKHVPFIEKDIETDPGAEEEMTAKATRAGLPTGSIPIIDVHGHLVVGFNPEQLDALISEAL